MTINPGVIQKIPRVITEAPSVIALGDSAISGEAGRWAGNTNQSPSKTDALGTTAYHDIPGAESTPGCHRSKSAEVHIGDGVQSLNLSCSGARTYSRMSDGQFKPGIDFYNTSGRKGQALALQEYATAHDNIKAVVVLIGANDYGFAEILETCVINWLTSPSWWKNYCQDDSNLVQMFSASNINKITNDVKTAFQNVKTAMASAGYADGEFEILAQTYSAPLPTASGFRYPETGFTRQTIGGCGTWNSDANWARNTVVNTLNNTIKNAVAGHAERAGAGDGERAQRPQALREHGRTARGEGRVHVAERRRGGQDRVGAPDPHADDGLPALPAAGGRAPELLGPARAAQLLPPGVRRRRRARRQLRARHRAQRQG